MICGYFANAATGVFRIFGGSQQVDNAKQLQIESLLELIKLVFAGRTAELCAARHVPAGLPTGVGPISAFGHQVKPRLVHLDEIGNVILGIGVIDNGQRSGLILADAERDTVIGALERGAGIVKLRLFAAVLARIVWIGLGQWWVIVFQKVGPENQPRQ
ncbi:hypothetical protein [Roseovarius nanhaiticus]|uniref:hypothetical protein n=1 Tax=Roseovarius nanhaiticus TaxID=573024 RepID=UPI0024938C1F|nr:hypothetical protein [Roseovarius nanhaiticus]